MPAICAACLANGEWPDGAGPEGGEGEGGRLTVLGGDVEGVARALQVRTRDDQLLAPDLGGARDDSAQVVRVSPLAVVHAPEDGVGEVDADLPGCGREGGLELASDSRPKHGFSLPLPRDRQTNRTISKTYVDVSWFVAIRCLGR